MLTLKDVEPLLEAKYGAGSDALAKGVQDLLHEGETYAAGEGGV